MSVLKYIIAYFFVYWIIVFTSKVTFRIINKNDLNRILKRGWRYLNIFFDPIGLPILILFFIAVICTDFPVHNDNVVPAQIAEAALKTVETYITYISGVAGVLIGLAFVPFSFLKKEDFTSIVPAESMEELLSPFMRVAVGYFLSFAFLLLTKSAILDGSSESSITVISSIAVMTIPYFIICIIKELFFLVYLFDEYIKNHVNR